MAEKGKETKEETGKGGRRRPQRKGGRKEEIVDCPPLLKRRNRRERERGRVTRRESTRNPIPSIPAFTPVLAAFHRPGLDWTRGVLRRRIIARSKASSAKRPEQSCYAHTRSRRADACALLPLRLAASGQGWGVAVGTRQRPSCPMRPPEVAFAAAFVAVAALLGGAAAAFPAALTLERALPHRGVPAEHLRERDRARHAGRGLLGGGPAVAGVVDFPVEGSANPYMVGWVSCFAFFPFCFPLVLWLGSGGLVVCDRSKRWELEPVLLFKFIGVGVQLKLVPNWFASLLVGCRVSAKAISFRWWTAAFAVLLGCRRSHSIQVSEPAPVTAITRFL